MSIVIGYFSAFFFVVYLLTAFVLPSVRVCRQTGISALTFGKGDSAHDFVGRWFKIILGLIPLVIFLYLLGPRFYIYLLPVQYMIHAIVQ